MSLEKYALHRIKLGPDSDKILNVSAEYIHCFTATREFEFAFDHGSRDTFFAGMTLKAPGGFKVLTLFNPSPDDDLVVEIATGIGDIRDNRLSLAGQIATRPARPDVFGQSSVIVSENLGALVLAANQDRASTTIGVESGSVRMLSADPGAIDPGLGVLLHQGQNYTMETTAEIWAWSDDGAVLRVDWLEFDS